MHRSNRNLRHRVVAVAIVVVGTLAATLAGSVRVASAEVRPICFPVVERVTYTRSFGAARDGGRAHEGTDLMGAKMHRLLSAVDGTIVDLRYRGDGSNADNAVRIRGDDGYYYAYLHMNNDSPGTDDGRATFNQVFAAGLAVNQRVRAGQLLGYMGDSGNAEGTTPHLHFEIRQPAARVWDSVAIDSYDSLRAARVCGPGVNSPTGPFDPLGGWLTADPDAATTGPDSAVVFARGGDQSLWMRSRSGSAWSEWTALGGVLSSGPAAAAAPDGGLAVFARGTDNQLWFRTRPAGGSWADWSPLGGYLTSDPDAARSLDGTMVVTARGGDQGIWYRMFDGATWSGWAPLGGRALSGPTVTSTGAATWAVHARGGDDALWQISASGGQWSGWSRIGGTLSSDPDATAVGGRVVVVARGSDLRLYATEDQTGWWTPVTTDGTAGGPSVTAGLDGRVEVFAVGTDNALYRGDRDASGSW